MGTTSEHSPELIAEIYRSRHPAYADCVVAILNDVGGGLVQRGTGTLVRIGAHSFLVTASHVVVRGEYDTEPLILYVVGKSELSVPLLGKALVSHQEGGADDDPADIAVIDLAPETIKGLGDCVYLRQTDIVAGDDLAEDYYFFTGFPTAWSQTDGEAGMGLGLLTYCTQLYKGPTSSFGGYRHDWHMLLKRGGALRVTLEPAEMPAQLNGISGCSIWRSYFTAAYGEGQARVVAVQTGTFQRQSVLKATRWSLVVKVIVDSFPDLKPSLALALPC